MAAATIEAASSFVLRQAQHEEAQDEVDFIGRCHEKRILMLSLSKHDECLCNRSRRRSVDFIPSPFAGVTS
jgi:hypothetical protein